MNESRVSRFERQNCRGSPLWLPAVIGRGEKYFAFFVIFGLDP